MAGAAADRLSVRTARRSKARSIYRRVSVPSRKFFTFQPSLTELTTAAGLIRDVPRRGAGASICKSPPFNPLPDQRRLLVLLHRSRPTTRLRRGGFAPQGAERDHL